MPLPPRRRAFEHSDDYADRYHDWCREGRYDAEDMEGRESAAETLTLEQQVADWADYLREVRRGDDLTIIRGGR